MYAAALGTPTLARLNLYPAIIIVHAAKSAASLGTSKLFYSSLLLQKFWSQKKKKIFSLPKRWIQKFIQSKISNIQFIFTIQRFTFIHDDHQMTNSSISHKIKTLSRPVINYLRCVYNKIWTIISKTPSTWPDPSLTPTYSPLSPHQVHSNCSASDNKRW